MGIFDKLRRRKIKKTVEKEEISRQKMKIMDREKRKITHGDEKADISAEIVTSKVKQVEITIEPRNQKPAPKPTSKPKKSKKKSKKEEQREYSDAWGMEKPHYKPKKRKSKRKKKGG